MKVVLSLVLLFFARPAFAVRTLVLNTPARAPFHFEDQSGVLDVLMREVFRRVGVDVRLQALPPERALLNANAGVEDGDAVRVGGLSEKYVNLVQVSERVLTTDFVAFGRGVRLDPPGWEGLKPFNVGIIRGHKIAEANVVGTRALTAVPNLALLFSLLKNGRVDVVVSERYFGWYAAREAGLFDVTPLEPPLATLEFFLYLNKKHANLARDVAQVLREMKADGSHADIMGRLRSFFEE